MQASETTVSTSVAHHTRTCTYGILIRPMPYVILAEQRTVASVFQHLAELWPSSYSPSVFALVSQTDETPSPDEQFRLPSSLTLRGNPPFRASFLPFLLIKFPAITALSTVLV